jgi:molecular chaperone GrpE
MTNDDRAQDQEQEQQRRIKFTDKRRIHADPDAESPPPAPQTVGARGEGGGGDRSGGSEHRERVAPRRSEAPPAEAAAADQPSDDNALKQQAAEYLDHLQRLQAEFANYKKRVLKEQTRIVEMAVEPLVARLLEVLDEFDLALMAAESKPNFDTFLHGVELVYAKLKDILGAEGLHRIEAEGRPFDPEQHEALMQSGSGDGEPVVADVLRNGYTLKGRVIRPAGVKVQR